MFVPIIDEPWIATLRSQPWQSMDPFSASGVISPQRYAPGGVLIPILCGFRRTL